LKVVFMPKTKPVESDAVRVALVLSELRPGGMERVVVHLANALVSQGVETLVICLQSAGEFAAALDPQVRFEALNSLKPMDLPAIWRMREVLLDFSPSVINLHDYTSAPYLVAANWLGRRVPVLFMAHGELYEGFDHLKNRLRFFAKGFAQLGGVSAEIVACHEKFLGWRGPKMVIRNGVPSVKVNGYAGRGVRNELGLKNGDFLFLSVGNPRTEKAFEDLIDAIALLPAGRNIQVVVAGTLNESDYCRMLKQRVEERQLGERFRFLGFRQDTAALYAAADAFVLSSRSEGLPMVILEAMMAGLPVVATKVGGIPDAVGDHALLVDAAQPAQLAAAMTRLITEPGLAETLGKTGKAHAEQTFGVERMVDAYVEWYGRVLSAEC
jgi:glycosyltransferase involved in cell wall biosynthesis